MISLLLASSCCKNETLIRVGRMRFFLIHAGPGEVQAAVAIIGTDAPRRGNMFVYKLHLKSIAIARKSSSRGRNITSFLLDGLS